MANTIVQVKTTPGLTLNLKLFPFDSDTQANATDTLTEATNRQGVYTATVTEALTGWHDAIVEDGSNNLIASGAVKLVDDTNTYRVHDEITEAVDGGAAPSAATIADAVWDETHTGHNTVDSYGDIVHDFLDAAISSRNSTTPPTAAAIADAVWDEDIITAHDTANTAGKILDDLITAGVTLADVAHGGTAATLTLERIIVASTTATEPAVKLTGNTTGAGLHAEGGTSGVGFYIKGNGNEGLQVDTTSGFHAILATGQGTGSGMSLVGGNTSAAGLDVAGGTGGHGFKASGDGAGAGFYAKGGSTGNGIYGDAGATSGHGLSAQGSGATGAGFNAVASGSGDSIKATDGISGPLDTVTDLTNLPAITSNWLTAAGINTDALDAIADGVWDETHTGHNTVDSYGDIIHDNLDTTVSSRSSHAALDVWHIATSSIVTASTIGVQLKDNVDTTVSSRASTTDVSSGTDRRAF